MTLESARDKIALQVSLGSGYNRHAVRLILGEINRVQGQDAVDGLIREFALDQVFGIKVGTVFKPF